MKKIRLDSLITLKELAKSRSYAQAMILAGKVIVCGRKIDKPGTLVSKDSKINIIEPLHPWVSRGGTKLSHAIKTFNINVSGLTTADIGSSTGGFTDVLLSLGAKMVYSVDVGYGQLAWKIRNDSRVKVIERTNAKNLNINHIDDPLDLVVCDVSFISVTKVLPKVFSLTKPGAILISLIKPQFEVGYNESEKGIVRDKILHDKVCKNISDWLEYSMDWQVKGLIKSPIKGAKGNTEFFIYAISKSA